MHAHTGVALNRVSCRASRPTDLQWQVKGVEEIEAGRLLTCGSDRLCQVNCTCTALRMMSAHHRIRSPCNDCMLVAFDS